MVSNSTGRSMNERGAIRRSGRSVTNVARSKAASPYFIGCKSARQKRAHGGDRASGQNDHLRTAEARRDYGLVAGKRMSPIYTRRRDAEKLARPSTSCKGTNRRHPMAHLIERWAGESNSKQYQ